MTSRRHKDFRFRLCLRITYYSAVVITEQAENICAVEIHGKAFAVGINDFHGIIVYFMRALDRYILGLLCFTRNGNRMQRKTYGVHFAEKQRECQGKRTASPGFQKQFRFHGLLIVFIGLSVIFYL